MATTNDTCNVFVAYLLWMVGGVFGWHLAYLNRSAQAFNYAVTWGGGGISWFLDFFRIPSYVTQANSSSLEYLQQLQITQAYHTSPPINSIFGLFWQYALANILRWLASCLIPQSFASNYHSVATFLDSCLQGFGLSLGIYLGGIGHLLPIHSASLFLPLLAFCTVATVVVSSNDILLSLDILTTDEIQLYTILVGMLIFYSMRYWSELTLSANNKIKLVKAASSSSSPPDATTTKPIWKRLLHHAVSLLVLLIVCSYGAYEHGAITMMNEDGSSSEYAIRDAIGNMLQSPAFKEFKSTSFEFFEEIQSKGFNTAWEELKYSLDPDGRQHALSVLGIKEEWTSATKMKSVVRRAYKKLVLKYHPDKVEAVNNDEQRKKMNDQFLKIQKAYELLSKGGSGSSNSHDEL